MALGKLSRREGTMDERLAATGEPGAAGGRERDAARIAGTTELRLTIADPVAHVRAPELFNAAFAAAGIDAVVVPAQVAPADLETFTRAVLASPTVRGLFVGIPHKAPLLQLADGATR